MAWYSAEIAPYPLSDLGMHAKRSMSDQVVCVRTNQPESIRLITELVGSRYCDVQPSPSGKSQVLYVAAPPNYPLAELRQVIHCTLRDQLLAAQLPRAESG